jgi:anti-sigma B factor antagonist
VERSSGAAPPPQPGGGGQDNAASLLAVHVEDSTGASIVTLSGELDLSTIPRMEAALMEQVLQRRAVLVDLTKLSFIDSSGIGVLIQAFNASNGIPVHLVIGPGSQVDRVFEIAGVTGAMPVFSDRERALASLAGYAGRATSNGAD